MKSISEMFDLSGKGAVVTGGGMGIGQAVALRLAEAGAQVMVTDIDLGAAQQTAEFVELRGGKAKAIQADASSGADAERVVRAAMESFGDLHILVNNAGIYPISPIFQTTEALWAKTINLNLGGPFLYAQAAAREMVRAGRGGKIINIASTDGLRPTGNLVHYNASKGGVIMLTKALALELGQYNIRVNAVAPGGIVTPGTAQTAESIQNVSGKSLEELSDEMFKRMPLGRMGEPDDVAMLVLFLASAASDYMTGSIVVVDGGYLLS